MLFYSVKLINPVTKEVYFHSISERPELPKQQVLDKYKGAMIVIDTTSHLLHEHPDQKGEGPSI